MQTSDTIREAIPPQNLEAEQSVLGSCLINREAVDTARSVLRPSNFYRDAHKKIFDAIRDLAMRSEPVDLITLSNLLRSREQLDTVGGASYLSSLADMVPTSANVGYYAKIVSDCSILRGLIEAASRITGWAYSSGDDAHTVASRAEAEVAAAGKCLDSGGGWESMQDIALRTFEHVEQRCEAKGQLSGIPTGFKVIDRHTNGFQRGDLIIVAGRPSMGKSSYLANIARNAAREGNVVGFIPLEESGLQEGMRIFSQISGIPITRLDRGFIRDDEWPLIGKSTQDMSRLPIHFSVDPTMNVATLRRRAQRLKADHDMSLLIVDHAGEIDTSDMSGNREDKKIGAVAACCKQIARQLNIVVILASQLNRGVELRPDKRPMLADLRDSGELEQKADVVQFLYRPEYYYQSPEDWEAYCKAMKRKVTPYPENVMEVITAKGRNIGIGSAELCFHREINRVTEFATEKV